MKNRAYIILPLLVYEISDNKKQIVIGWLTKTWTFIF